MSRARLLTRATISRAAMTAALLALAVGMGLAGTGNASAAATCTPLAKPGAVTAGAPPSDIGGEYSVLRRPRTARDHLSARLLAGLPESGISLSGIRYLAPGADGVRFYLVPAHHFLTIALLPLQCLTPGDASERAAQENARVFYAQHAVCVLEVVGQKETGACGVAPGDAGAFLAASRFGLVPDGISSVRAKFLGLPSVTATVHDNFWQLGPPAAGGLPDPCGLSWLDRTGLVLRKVRTCTVDADVV
jgi:hypothetical protein